MKVLVTGACGFVGKHLVPALNAAGHEVACTVLSDPVPSELSSSAASVQLLNVCDHEKTKEVVGDASPEAVFHLAGMAFAPAAARNFSKALEVNVGGVYSVCNALADLDGERRLILASSGEVYGKVSEDELPITEKSEPRPNNPYSVTKLQAEEVVRFFARRGLLVPYIMRLFNHIGPGQSSDFVCASFAEQLAEIAHGRREAVIRVGNLEAFRDFMDVRDVVRAYVSILEAPPGLYNISSGTSVKIDDILHILMDVSGISVEIQQDPERMRPSEVREIRGTFEKLHRAVGWKPEIDIESSLRDIFSFWYEKTAQREP